MAGMLVLLLAICFPFYMKADEADDILMLPSKMKTVKKEAFANDKSITSVMIPKSVGSIQSKAFANCVNLKEVILGNNANVDIAPDAFAGCGNIHFQAFPETAGELYALSHGFSCDLLEEGSSFLEKALELVTAHGGTTSILQSADFMTMRLIVRMDGNHLPDISAYSPEKILQEGDGIFFVQFGSVENTIDAYNALKGNAGVVFVENDACVEAIEDVIAASSVDPNVWDTKDPMGFEVYAPYVAEQNAGRALIAVIDSGVQKNAAYSARLRTDGISLVSGDPEWSNDKLLHGSMIAGIIGDCAGNTGVEILPVRVVAENGVANLTMIGLGIRYAISRGADVINLSLNFEENDYVSYWIDRAVAAGINVVVAAGNSKRDISKIYPANVPGVIAVSGIDNDYELSGTSNYGANIAFCAPDSYVTTSAYPTMVRKGTSFGAPMVATALALTKLDKNHTEEDLPVICRRLKDAIPDVNNYGYGLMQLDRLTESETYTITYNANGGTGAPESQIKTRGVDLILSTVEPTMTFTVTLDYGTGTTDTRTVKAAFADWKEEETGTKYAPGAIYTEDAAVTLYAQWINGTLGTLPSPTRDGFNFLGWFTEKTGGTIVTESTEVTENTLIYAQWGSDWAEEVEVYPANYIKVSPGTSVDSDTRVTMQVVMGVTREVAFQWQVKQSSSDVWKNTSLPGNQTDTLSFIAKITQNQSQFRVVLTDSAGNQIVSNSIWLFVY